VKVANGSIKPAFWWTLLACGLIFAAFGSRRISKGTQPLERAIFEVLESGTSYPDQAIQVCVIENGQLVLVDATYRPASGDTVVGSKPLRRVYTPAESGICHRRQPGA
jgi:hypothetical protein